MAKEESAHDIQTIVRLLAPKEVGIVLVPLSSVEETESTFFWTTVFLGIFTAILGAVISLFSSDYNNRAVITLLICFLCIFFGLTVAFAIIGFQKRRLLRERSSQTEESPIAPKPKLSEDKKLWLVAVLYRLHGDIRRRVFGDKEVLDETTFKNNLGKIIASKNKPRAVDLAIQLATKSTIISVDNSNPEEPLYKLNDDFEASKYLKYPLLQLDKE